VKENENRELEISNKILLIKSQAEDLSEREALLKS
jgi:hypothetical protein